MDKLISVIIPVYKVEKYLPRCIESVLNQTYKNFELILVDDGSPDNSGKICDEYALKDARINVIHKENGGVSSARNAGIDVAKGEYINFIDSDDWVPSDSLEILLELLHDNFADLSIGGREDLGKKIKQKTCELTLVEFGVSEEEKVAEFLENSIVLSSCGKLYKTSLIKQNRLFFPESLKLAEDAVFVRNYLRVAKRIANTKSIVYFYNRTNENSATHKNYIDNNKWELYSLKNFANLVDLCLTREDIKNMIISRQAYNKYFYIAYLYCNYLHKKAAIKKLQETKEMFNKYMMLNENIYINKGYIKKVDAVKNNNFNMLYKLIIKESKGRLPKRILRNLYNFSIKRMIERKRDGLRNYK